MISICTTGIFSSTDTLNALDSFPSSEFNGLQLHHKVCHYTDVKNKKTEMV